MLPPGKPLHRFAWAAAAHLVTRLQTAADMWSQIAAEKSAAVVVC